MATKPKPITEVPVTWVDLNEMLMAGDLVLAEKLFELEKANRARRQFLLRIHSRINKLRAELERGTILKNAR